MPNDERVGRLVQAIENLAETSGQKEATKVIPNCRVVDADPVDIPGYIIVENELGYYVPAIKSPDITYQDDDTVNLLIIKGTEPIAFQHGTGSGTGGYPGALPLTTKGDIVTRDASDNIRLGVEENDKVLTAVSSEASGLDWIYPSKLIAPDGAPNPAWEVDNTGNLGNSGNGILDLNGIADALVLDADGDTSISSPTDNQIDFEAGGVDIARITAAGLTLPQAGDDIFVEADGAGIFKRSVNHWFTPSDHFNTFSGYTWASTGVWDGAPSTVDVATFPSILRLINDSITEDHFAYVAATGSTSQVVARLTKGSDSYVGIRLDDGSDNNYFEIRLIQSASSGMFGIEVHNRDGGGSITTTSRADPIPPAFYVLQISRAATGTWTGFASFTTDAPVITPLGVSTGSVSWTPSRAGVIFGQRSVVSSPARAGLFDWFFSN